MSRALLIGREPGVDLGYQYVSQGPYDAVVIGSLTVGQLLHFSLEPVLTALTEIIQRVINVIISPLLHIKTECVLSEDGNFVALSGILLTVFVAFRSFYPTFGTVNLNLPIFT